MVPGKKQDRELRERRYILETLDREVDRQRLSVASRASAGMTRASILIASAGVLMSVEAATLTTGKFEVASMCLAAVAVVLGAIVLVPRHGGENGIEDLQDELWNLKRDAATHRLLHRKLEILREDERLLKQRSLFAIYGFGTFVLALLALMADLICQS